MKTFLLDLLQNSKIETAACTIAGGVSAIGHAILQMNLLQISWGAYAVSLTQKIIEVAIVGVIGAAAGYLTTRFLKKNLK